MNKKIAICKSVVLKIEGKVGLPWTMVGYQDLDPSRNKGPFLASHVDGNSEITPSCVRAILLVHCTIFIAV